MASLNEPLQGGPYPNADDPPNVPNDMRLIVEWAASRSVMRFPSTSDRDTLLPSPVEGQLCATGAGTGLRIWLYANGGWRAIYGQQASPFRSGEIGISFGGSNTATAPVTFDPPYTGPGTPTVMTTYGSTNTIPVVVTGAQSISNTGFTARIMTADGNTHGGTRVVRWFAFKAEL